MISSRQVGVVSIQTTAAASVRPRIVGQPDSQGIKNLVKKKQVAIVRVTR